MKTYVDEDGYTRDLKEGTYVDEDGYIRDIKKVISERCLELGWLLSKSQAFVHVARFTFDELSVIKLQLLDKRFYNSSVA